MSNEQALQRRILDLKTENYILKESLENLGVNFGEDPFRYLKLEDIHVGMWIYDTVHDEYLKVEKIRHNTHINMGKPEIITGFTTKHGIVKYRDGRYTRYARRTK